MIQGSRLNQQIASGIGIAKSVKVDCTNLMRKMQAGWLPRRQPNGEHS
jgi:FixJ family two-component response regulator